MPEILQPREIGLKSILIADDQESTRALYDAFFSEYEHVSLNFSLDGIDAYYKCIMQKFDVILLDHEMPRLNGLDFLVALRSTVGINQHTPVIVISGFLPELQESVKMFKDVSFLNKPFDLNTLKTYVKDLIL